jgi:nicotinamide riboside kinase
MLKIAITGPESTGKSELAAQLAAHYQGHYVPEYARYYVARLNRAYTTHDLWRIAQIQMSLEERYAQRYAKEDLLFCDTEMTVIKVWHEHAFGTMPDYMQQLWAQRLPTYHLYLLTDIDLPWQPDPQREHPHLRNYFFELYKNTLQTNNIAFEIVRGRGVARLQNAIDAIEQYKIVG